MCGNHLQYRSRPLRRQGNQATQLTGNHPENPLSPTCRAVFAAGQKTFKSGPYPELEDTLEPHLGSGHSLVNSESLNRR